MPPTQQWVIADNRAASTLLGRGEETLKILEDAFGVRLTARGNMVAIAGSDEAQSQVREALDLLAEWAYAGEAVRPEVVRAAAAAVQEGSQREFRHLLTETVLTTGQGKPVRPRTVGQQLYIEAIRTHELVFGVGPAGTGKTYLAVAMAVRALRNHEVSRIVLTRPAVEAGEKLGFLPGALEEKVDPYLRPLYDALFEMLGSEAALRYRERGQIEVAPLAYMRGRSLTQSFIILDEAQNTTHEQMKMFLTRLGQGSRAVVTGDLTQVDLPRGTASGLATASRILARVPGIAVVTLDHRDVVRHPLVAAIVAAYEAAEAADREGNDR
ncbi:phosphate starvation-induced protein [Candidatus Hydrogenisulfobacillus filiaventi]|uniref:PhoH-like protein n=1 Tax=Candidatus Hydrogenisulfobacillus filiaventi TaxID=2707344 RepID=A0A6F8ZJJ1_9FIRM|nr:PhoH family protein [Bacillota bacterium]CAB1129623.1 phosphate starvation-induced protein [Candidatus Hydrogenisulfobacillus filiaventi]